MLQAVSYLVHVSEGDLRKAITLLQSATRLTGGKEVTERVVIEISGVGLVISLGKNLSCACSQSSGDQK